MALVNGVVAYTCTARLDESSATIEPLRSRPVIRDLVTETAPAEETLR
jgi:succinate dehydrogenase/fumarate reductase-like Fe-S protein